MDFTFHLVLTDNECTPIRSFGLSSCLKVKVNSYFQNSKALQKIACQDAHLKAFTYRPSLAQCCNYRVHTMNIRYLLMKLFFLVCHWSALFHSVSVIVNSCSFSHPSFCFAVEKVGITMFSDFSLSSFAAHPRLLFQ